MQAAAWSVGRLRTLLGRAPTTKSWLLPSTHLVSSHLPSLRLCRPLAAMRGLGSMAPRQRRPVVGNDSPRWLSTNPSTKRMLIYSGEPRWSDGGVVGEKVDTTYVPGRAIARREELLVSFLQQVVRGRETWPCPDGKGAGVIPQRFLRRLPSGQVPSVTVTELWHFMRMHAGLSPSMSASDKERSLAVWQVVCSRPLFQSVVANMVFLPVCGERDASATYSLIEEARPALRKLMSMFKRRGLEPRLGGEVVACMWDPLLTVVENGDWRWAYSAVNELTSWVDPSQWVFRKGSDGAGIETVLLHLKMARVPLRAVALWPRHWRASAAARVQEKAIAQVWTKERWAFDGPTGRRTFLYLVAIVTKRLGPSAFAFRGDRDRHALVSEVLDKFVSDLRAADNPTAFAVQALELFTKADITLPSHKAALPAALAMAEALLPLLRAPTGRTLSPELAQQLFPKPGVVPSHLDDIHIGSWLSRAIKPHLRRVSPRSGEAEAVDLHDAASLLRTHLAASLRVAGSLPSHDTFLKWLAAYRTVCMHVDREQWEGYQVLSQMLRQWPHCQPDDDRDSACLARVADELRRYVRGMMPSHHRAHSMPIRLNIKEPSLMEVRASVDVAFANLSDAGIQCSPATCGHLFRACFDLALSAKPLLPVLERCCDSAERHPHYKPLTPGALAATLRVPPSLPPRVVNLTDKKKEVIDNYGSVVFSLTMLGVPNVDLLRRSFSAWMPLLQSGRCVDRSTQTQLKTAFHVELLLRAMRATGELAAVPGWQDHPCMSSDKPNVFISPSQELVLTQLLRHRPQPAIITDLHQDVWRVVNDIGSLEPPQAEYYIAPTIHVDVAFPRHRLVLETVGPFHCDQDTGRINIRTMGGTLSMQGLGWTVVHVPSMIWDGMGETAKQEFIATVLCQHGLVDAERLRTMDLLEATETQSKWDAVAALTFPRLPDVQTYPTVAGDAGSPRS